MLACLLARLFVCLLADYLACWLACRFANFLVDWLARWLTGSLASRKFEKNQLWDLNFKTYEYKSGTIDLKSSLK